MSTWNTGTKLGDGGGVSGRVEIRTAELAEVVAKDGSGAGPRVVRMGNMGFPDAIMGSHKEV